jgi:hypothetical protein
MPDSLSAKKEGHLMNLFAQLDGGATNQELRIAILAVAVVLGLCLWRMIRWLAKGPILPDPWDEQVAAEVARDEAPALCHHCLAPHDSLVNFCPDCGAPVGAYTNWLPYPWLFSVGYTLRAGTSGNFKRSPLTIIGFFLFGAAEYSFFAPIYWFRFLQNLSRPRESQLPPVNDDSTRTQQDEDGR